MFHSKTRVVESIAPEALTLTLFYGSSNIVVKWDEFNVLHLYVINLYGKILSGCFRKGRKSRYDIFPLFGSYRGRN